MQQLHAAYLFDSVKEIFSETYFNEKINPLLKQLSSFDIETSTPLQIKNMHPQTAIIHNMITMGRPTRPSEYVEKTCSIFLKQTQRGKNIKRNHYPFNNNDLRTNLEKALYIIDPRYETNEIKGNSQRNVFKRKVVDKFVNATDEAFRHLFHENKKQFSSILPKINKLNFDELKLTKYTPDFIIDLPIPQHGTRGAIIDIDHEMGMVNMDFLAIEQKEKIARTYGYKYIYVKNGNLQEAITKFEHFTFNDYFDKLRKNHNAPLYNSISKKTALQYILSPIAIARIQKTIIDFIIAGQLNINAESWEIAVIERDVPAAFLAVEDLKRRYKTIYEFLNVKQKFPEINLEIYNEAEFDDCKLHDANRRIVKPPKNFNQAKNYDLLIDIAILQKSNSKTSIPANQAKQTAKIRSSHAKITSHSFYYCEKIDIPQFTKEEFARKTDILNQIIEDLFRVKTLNNIEQRRLVREITGTTYTMFHAPQRNIPETEILFALFNPGLTISIQPNNLSQLSKLKKLQKNGIFAEFHLDGKQHKIKDKEYITQIITQRKAILLYITADLLRSPCLQTAFNSLKPSDINLKGIYVNGMSAISEFSSDFNPIYKGVTKRLENLLNLKSQKTPIVIKGHHCDYNVKEDIKAETNIDNIIEEKPCIPDLQIKKIEFQIDDTSSQEEMFEKSEAKKQELILDLVKKIPDSQKILIIYPFSSRKQLHYCQSANEAVAYLQKEMPEETIELFHQPDNTETNLFNLEEYTNAKIAYENFIGNKCRILLASVQIIHAFRPNKLTNIILSNTPAESDTLYKIINLFSPFETNNLYLINDNTEFVNQKTLDTATINGIQKNMEQVHKTTPDKFIKERKIHISFPGRNIDLAISNELLSIINSDSNKLNLNNNNDVAMQKLISQHTSYKFEISTLQDIIETSSSINQLFEKLSKFTDISIVNENIELPYEIEKLYLAHRTPAKTLLHLSRFYEIGLIDDYTVDMNSGEVTIHKTKRSDVYYKEQLKSILNRYISEKKVTEALSKINEYNGNSTTEKIINFYTNFLYDEVCEQRYTNIDTIDIWIEKLFNQIAPEIQMLELKNYFNTTFSAKYLNSLSPQSLITATASFEGGSFNTVMEFIYNTRFLKNNIEHLYKSTQKAQKIYPNNYVILLLKAFAEFSKYGVNENFEQSFQALYEGFEIMEQEENPDYQEAIDRRTLFFDMLRQYNKETYEKATPLIYLKTYMQKLTDFNKKFLLGFDKNQTENTTEENTEKNQK